MILFRCKHVQNMLTLLIKHYRSFHLLTSVHRYHRQKAAVRCKVVITIMIEVSAIMEMKDKFQTFEQIGKQIK